MIGYGRDYTDDRGEPLPEPRRTSWTAPELMAHTFPDPKWAVPGLLAEGLTLLVGAPKIGKSWAALNLALSVATGGKALGKVDVEVGDVLYLALEDTARRLQSRLGKVLAGSPAPSRLTIETECAVLAAGGADRIDGWLTAHPSARLVVIDVFARVRGRSGQQVSAYESDYLPAAAIKAIADRHGVAVLLVHHTRKASAEDVMDEVSGTQGLNGAADATLVLKRSRGQADATLDVTGRDIEEAQYALTWHADLGAWQMLDGPAVDHTVSDIRRMILAHLREVGAATPKEIADALGEDHKKIKQRCWQMGRDGQLVSDGGRYLPPVTRNPHNPVTQDQKHSAGDQGLRVTAVTGYDGGSTPDPSVETTASPTADPPPAKAEPDDLPRGYGRCAHHGEPMPPDVGCFSCYAEAAS